MSKERCFYDAIKVDFREETELLELIECSGKSSVGFPIVELEEEHDGNLSKSTVSSPFAETAVWTFEESFGDGRKRHEERILRRDKDKLFYTYAANEHTAIGTDYSLRREYILKQE